MAHAGQRSDMREHAAVAVGSFAERRPAAWRSTVVLKAAMATSGLIMVLYLRAICFTVTRRLFTVQGR